LGPQPEEEDDGEGGHQIPVSLVTGGEGRGAREREGVEAHLRRVLDGEREVRKGVIGEGAEAAAEVNGGEVIQARSW
jgi:hypothetical protein